MSCGCKQKPSHSGPKIIKVNDNTHIMNEPQFNQEDVDRIQNWLSSHNKTKEDTDFVYEFNRIHFGEHMMGYCDPVCQDRIRKRVEHMKEKLNLYGK